MNNSPFPTFSTSSIVINHGNYRNGNYTITITTMDPILTMNSFLKSQISAPDLMETSLGFPVKIFPSTNPLNSQETARLLVSTATRTFDKGHWWEKPLRNEDFPWDSHHVSSDFIYDFMAGWWFGTWLLWLSIYWECHHPNWRTHIFQRGRYTTNQLWHLLGFYGISWEYHWVLMGFGIGWRWSEDLSNGTGRLQQVVW